VLPALIHHLSSSNYVSYSYAAITIERVLFIKRGNAMLYVRIVIFAIFYRFTSVASFSQVDISDTAKPILIALFAKIRSGDTPEKIAENDYLMKCNKLFVVLLSSL